ncbi:MAG: Ig-like domain-containing protein [Bacteroidales bacterium]
MLLIVIFLLPTCAKIAAPVGGPRDTIPPLFLGSRPAMKSVNFSGKRIELFFDEHIQIKGGQNPVSVSPPFILQQPDYIVGNKSLIVSINEDLRPQTTYTINFGEALTDLNESNPALNFEYVFSTGSHIDSLSMIGRVTDAYTNEPPGKSSTTGRWLIMFYRETGDSVPLKKLPDVVGRVDANGLFRLHQIPADTFLVFSLRDENNNYLYDLPTEKIAFCDTLVVTDSRYAAPDTLPTRQTTLDSLFRFNPAFFQYHLQLRSFQEPPKVQYLKSRDRIDTLRIRLIFNKPHISDLQFSLIDSALVSYGTSAFIPEISATRDTFDYWITDPFLSQRDRLTLAFRYTATDSLLQPVEKLDTLIFRNPFLARKSQASQSASLTADDSLRMVQKAMKDSVKMAKKIARAAKKGRTLSPGSASTDASRITRNTRRTVESTSEELVDRFPLKMWGSSSVISPLQQLLIEAVYPIKTFDTTAMRLTVEIDSVLVPQPFRLVRDSLSPRKLRLQATLKEGGLYRFYIDSAAIQGHWEGFRNDTLRIFRFSTLKTAEASGLLVSVSPFCGPAILQLIDPSSSKIVAQTRLSSDTVASLPYIRPGKYRLRAIHDTNDNGKWDTGNWMERRQPESIEIYKDTLDLKKGFNLEVKWPFEKAPCQDSLRRSGAESNTPSPILTTEWRSRKKKACHLYAYLSEQRYLYGINPES